MLSSRSAVSATFALLVVLGAVAMPAPASAEELPPKLYVNEKAAPPVNGSYTPIVGDFSDVDYYDDILWYAPGKTQDATWYMYATQGKHRTVLRTVNGTGYLPTVSDYDGNQAGDVVWFAPSGAMPAAFAAPDVVSPTSVARFSACRL